jgi:predicted DsbA family dithiol-disulfide isomerase
VSGLARKYGVPTEQARAMVDRMTATAEAAGVAVDFERVRPGNTFAAHRLLHLAADRGRQHDVKARFLRGYLGEGAAVGLPEELERLAVDAGLDRDEVVEVLDSDAYADAVRADEADAARLGVTGVPFFVVDGRYAVPGAQPPEVMLQVLDRCWQDRVAEAGDHAADGVGDEVPATGEVCGPDGCEPA